MVSSYNGYVLFAPDDFTWSEYGAGVFERHTYVFATIAALYYPLVVFLLPYIMKDRPAFQLQLPLMLWNTGLAVFSTIGAFYVVPLALEPVWAGHSWTTAICAWQGFDDRRAFWGFLFNLSKFVEFGDTVFIVLRKKELVLLQHYHHLATCLYCWYGAMHKYRYDNTNAFFAGMNLCVHSAMYSWYAASRAGWRSPKWLMMLLTLLQTTQMVAGVTIMYIAIYGDSAAGCGRWVAEDPWGVSAALVMYMSYFVLFGKLFADNYCGKRTLKKPSSKMSSQKKAS